MTDIQNLSQNTRSGYADGGNPDRGVYADGTGNAQVSRGRSASQPRSLVEVISDAWADYEADKTSFGFAEYVAIQVERAFTVIPNHEPPMVRCRFAAHAWHRPDSGCTCGASETSEVEQPGGES